MSSKHLAKTRKKVTYYCSELKDLPQTGLDIISTAANWGYMQVLCAMRHSGTGMRPNWPRRISLSKTNSCSILQRFQLSCRIKNVPWLTHWTKDGDLRREVEATAIAASRAAQRPCKRSVLGRTSAAACSIQSVEEISRDVFIGGNSIQSQFSLMMKRLIGE
jgi:hypothetical protein